MKNRQQQKTLILKNPDGTVMTVDETKAEVQQHFTTLGTKPSGAPPCPQDQERDGGVEICQEITDKELESAIRSLKNSKASLADDIPNEFGRRRHEKGPGETV